MTAGDGNGSGGDGRAAAMATSVMAAMAGAAMDGGGDDGGSDGGSCSDGGGDGGSDGGGDSDGGDGGGKGITLSLPPAPPHTQTPPDKIMIVGVQARCQTLPEEHPTPTRAGAPQTRTVGVGARTACHHTHLLSCWQR